MNRSLSIIIPAYNEASRLPQTLATVQAFIRETCWKFHEIVVVDDGSSDRTPEIVREAARLDPQVRLELNPGNRGKGYSVRHGMLVAKGEWSLLTDADLSTPIDELEKLWGVAEADPSEAGDVPGSQDFVIGSRALNRELIGVRQPFFRESAGKFFNFVMKVVVGLPYRDTQCGFKLIRSAAAKRIFPLVRIERFGFDVEAIFIARRLGYRVAEVPVRWNHSEGSKVSLWNGVQSFADLFAIRWNQIRGRYRLTSSVEKVETRES